jgi:LytS/YehU family sensor histidine kinase
MLLPWYAAALALPLFLWLARRAPLSRATWRRAAPAWIAAVLAMAILPEIALLLWIGGGLGPQAAAFLGVRLLGTGPLVLGSAALAHAIEHRRRARAAAAEAARARAELAHARLATLAAQLRPHFLFNTLQSISTLVHRDPEAADTMIGKLGDLLRASLDVADTPLISLDRELRLTTAYLDIMRERFGHRLAVSVDSDPRLAALVPPFLLQPLVENAVQHGIEPSRTPGQVRIRTAASGERLTLEVWNTADEAAELDDRNGVGLGNTRERLRALYGDEAAVAIRRDGAAGTCVTLSLPWIRDAERADR